MTMDLLLSIGIFGILFSIVTLPLFISSAVKAIFCDGELFASFESLKGTKERKISLGIIGIRLPLESFGRFVSI